MKIENSIGWCDETTNAVTGCDKVSPGCKNCYAATGTRARVLRAQGIETWGPKGVRHPVAQFAEKLRRLNKLCICDRCHETQPYARVGKECGLCPKGSILADDECMGKLRRIRLFADSNSDWLDGQWPIETLANFLKEIRDAPNVDVLLLTKRPENFRERLIDVMKLIEDSGSRFESALHLWILDWMTGAKIPSHVWLGVTVENQEMADLRIPQLLQMPAAVRFLSCEPLLESVDLDVVENSAESEEEKSFAKPTRRGCELDWVIVGGESGKNRRDCGVSAIVSVAEQCQAAGVPVYVKQDCAFKSGEQGRIPAAVWGLKQFPKQVVLRE